MLDDVRFNPARAFLIIVNGGIYPTAYGIAPHLPSIEGPQQFRYRSHVLHTRIEPEMEAKWDGEEDTPYSNEQRARQIMATRERN